MKKVLGLAIGFPILGIVVIADIISTKSRIRSGLNKEA
jgi:hypothetical protein